MKKQLILTGSLLLVSLLTSLPVQAQVATPNQALEIYPMGKIFPFMGYSGVPTRDAKSGFSVTGPDYGTSYSQPEKKRSESYAKMRAAALPYPAMIGLNMHFHDKKKHKPLSAEEIKKQVTAQMKERLKDPLVCWWYISPEEIRFWYKNEFDYLKTVSETIRELDPYNRPIWMYEPNHRSAGALVKTGQFQDIIGKGCYTNLAGFQKDRIWVRWSIDQEIEAIEELAKQDKRPRIALVMPELCQDPKDPADDQLIPAWTRHDVYLGLMSGAKGVSIWSLFKRGGVRRTWQIWYDSYAQLGKELTGDLKLGEVFLFGKDNTSIKIKQTKGPEKITLFVGDRTKLELGTITEAERKGGTHIYPLLNTKALDYKGSTYLFLCNSHAEKNLAVTVSVPANKHTISLPDKKSVRLNTQREIRIQIPPYAVHIYRISDT